MSEDKNIDLESCVTASTKQNSGCQLSPGFKAAKNCAIAVQHLDARAILINVAIEEVDGDLLFSSARRQISQAIANSWHQRIVGKLFMGLVVGTARVKQVRQCFSGSQVVRQTFGSSRLLTFILKGQTLSTRIAISCLFSGFHPRPPAHRSTPRPSPPLALNSLPSQRRRSPLFTSRRQFHPRPPRPPISTPSSRRQHYPQPPTSTLEQRPRQQLHHHLH